MLYGSPLKTNFPFVIEVPPSDREPELLVELMSSQPGPEEGECIFDSADLEVLTGVPLKVFRSAEDYQLWVAGTACYRVGPRRIQCYPISLDPRILEVHLLGLCFSFWLELRGTLALHASSLRLGERAILLLGGNGSGKTTLALQFLRAGHSLLSDDISGLTDSLGQWLVLPSYPQLRVWPRTISDLALNPDHLRPVLPGSEKRRVPVGPGGVGSFHDRRTPVAAAFLIRRKLLPSSALPSASKADLQKLPGPEALIALVQHSFLKNLPRRAGLERDRFDLLAKLVLEVPCFSLSCPEGLEHLGSCCAVIEEAL